MPLLLGYLSSLNEEKVGHVTRAFYALENFMENLGKLNKFDRTASKMSFEIFRILNKNQG